MDDKTYYLYNICECERLSNITKSHGLKSQIQRRANEFKKKLHNLIGDKKYKEWEEGRNKIIS